MRVLIVPSWYPEENKPNSGIFFKEQVKALQEFGVEVIVAYPEIHSLKELLSGKVKRGFSVTNEDGVETYRIKEFNYLPKVKTGSGAIYYPKLKKIYSILGSNGKKPDLIHAHAALWGGWAAAKMAKKHQIPFIITEHSSAFLRGLIKDHQKPYIKETYDTAEKVIVVGPGLQKELKNYTAEEKIELIPNIVDTSKFKPSKMAENNDKFRFFSLAFLNKNKGFDVLLRAFEQAFKGNEKVELVIGGDGAERSALEQLTRDLGLEKQVTFSGELSREKAAAEMQRCNAFVLASRFETFGIVYIEALACGKPIIATRCGGPDMIVNEQNGLLVDVDDIGALSESMKTMLKNYSAYSPEAIAQDCQNRFSKQPVIKKIINAYQQALGGS